MPTETTEPLARLRGAHEDLRRAETALDAAVLAARAEGATWQDIGETLGVSRQAAFKRFGRPTDPESGEPLATGPVIDPAALAECAFRAIAEGDDPTLRSLMTHACSRQLTRTRIAEVWWDVLSNVGELESFSEHETRARDGGPLPGATMGPLVARVLLQHEAGEMVAHVSVNRAGKIDGLLVVPPGAEADLPF